MCRDETTSPLPPPGGANRRVALSVAKRVIAPGTLILPHPPNTRMTDFYGVADATVLVRTVSNVAIAQLAPRDGARRLPPHFGCRCFFFQAIERVRPKNKRNSP
jgi:hypothetical protein